jgi:hypothetical protein
MRKNLFLTLFSLLLLLILVANAQSVGIGTPSPDSSSILELKTASKGFLPPRMNAAQMNAINLPATGLVIYNTTTNSLEYYNGISWNTTIHYIGESYGGGIVFYVYDNGQHGLIAANADQATSVIRWYGGSYTNTCARGNGVGAGLKNTAIIIANQGSVDGNTFAARVCNEYSVTVEGVTYGDWYLPSKFELNLLYQELNVIGGFTTSSAYYWSSTESDANHAYIQSFIDGSQGPDDKNQPIDKYVRAIRSF